MTTFVDDEWRKAAADTADLLQEDDITPNAPALVDNEETIYSLQHRFLRYHELFLRISHIFDVMIQPQKRQSVFRLLKSIAGRYAELRSQLIKLSRTEVPIFDDILVDLSKTPSYIHFPVPKFIRHDRRDVVEGNNKLCMDLISKFQLSESLVLAPTPTSSSTPTSSQTMTEDQAIRLIQRAERARQGKLRSRYVYLAWLAENGLAEGTEERAASLIQRVFRSWSQRKKEKQRYLEELQLYSMIPNLNELPHDNAISKYNQAQLRHRLKTKEVQRQHEKLYLEGIEKRRKNLRSGREQEFIEDKLHEQFSEWVAMIEEKTGGLPDAIDGFKDVIDPKEEEVGEKKEEDGQEKTEKKGKKGAKAGKKGKKAAKGGKKGKKDKGDDSEAPPPNSSSSFAYDLVTSLEEYFNLWEARSQTARDPTTKIQDLSVTENSTYYRDLILEDERPVWEAEVRDNMMKVLEQELEDLQAAVKLRSASAAKKGKAKKGGKKGKKGKKGGKKGKKGSKKDSKKSKDKGPKEGESPLENFARLVRFGHVKPEEPLHLEQLITSYSRISGIIAKTGSPLLDPCFGSTVALLTSQVSLALGFENIRQEKVLGQSILIFGPSGCGKKFLVKSLAYELGAILIDLSPELLAHHASGKMAELVKIVLSIPKTMGPTIIMVPEAHRMFASSKRKRREGRKIRWLIILPSLRRSY
ncbi:hypothetical protein GEMRC1_007686 [Eukaryota sp. GEM-RC1]